MAGKCELDAPQRGQSPFDSPLKLGSPHCNISIVGIFLSGLQQSVAFLLVANVGVLTWLLAR
jgi:hypothetical protein